MKRMKSLCYLTFLVCVSTWLYSQWVRLPEFPTEEWTVQRMEDEMGKLGYKARWIDSDHFPLAYVTGLYLARDNDPRSWDEIVARRIKVEPTKNWGSLVVVSKAPNGFSSYRTPEECRIGPFDFYGDPREIEQIAQHFK